VRAWADKMAQSGATILIEGPTGSGKEVLARYIHEQSGRKGGPFVKVDCATIPQNLIESQLFGHEKGAFTGAESLFIGLCERADGGTLFLDEIANLSLDTQTKFLQFLNDFTLTRLGGRETVKVNVRCIAASNKSLPGLIAEGLFREDLYYRLSVFQLRMPSLVERREDIPMLCEHFLAYFNVVYRKNIPGFSSRALEKLLGHAWPGNIRELKNVMERAVLFCTGDRIGEEGIQFDPASGPARKTGKSLSSAYRLCLTPDSIVTELLEKHLGRVSAVVKELGTTNGAFYYFLRQRGIDPNRFRKGFPGRKS
jgi:DNA-binding NtrC family response regulator